MADAHVPTAPAAVSPSARGNQGEDRPPTASNGEWNQSLFQRPESSSTFDVDWQVDRLPGGARIAGNSTGMDLDRRIRGMARTERAEDSTSGDRNP